LEAESKYFSPVAVFIRLVLVLPVAWLLALGAFILHPQYSPESDLWAATRPIIALFSVAYTFVAFIVASRRANFHESVFVLVSLGLGLAYLFAISGILVLHISYSLAFLAVFISVSYAWMLWTEFRRVIKLSRLNYLIVQQGAWRDIKNIPTLSIKLISTPRELSQWIKKDQDSALAIDSHVIFPSQWSSVILDAIALKRPIIYFDTIFEDVHGFLNLETFSPDSLSEFFSRSTTTVAKRAIDVIAALACLVLFCIPLLIIGLFIKLESAGPVIFRQARIGKAGKTFVLYKLRTMREPQNNLGEEITHAEQQVTRIGHWLRRLRIDEWPQFINVLKGDMSLVGPRPETETLVSSYRESIAFYELRHVVRPGITGWAQTKQGYTNNTEEARRKLQYDLYYIKHFSLLLDIRIILSTFAVIVSGRGAR